MASERIINEYDSTRIANAVDTLATNLADYSGTTVTPTNAMKAKLPSQTTADRIADAVETLAENVTDLGKSADDISYDNTTSGLSATDVQTAIDEIDAEVDDIVNVYGSKNLYPNEMVSGSVNGITVTVNVDGSFTLSNGSTNAFTQITLKNNSRIIPADGNYTLSGYTGSLTIAEIGLELYDETTQSTAVAIPTAIPSAMLYKDHYYSARLNIASGIDFTTPVTIYPMLRDASITDSTYEPYSMTNQQITKRLSGQSNRNLLDNPFFTINQRGQSSYTGSGYTVDRWILLDANATVTPVSGGVTITSASNSYWTIGQKFETKYTGNIFTVSVNVDGVIHSFTFTSGFNGSSQNDGTIWVWLTIEGYVYIGQAYSTTITIRAVKLELGSVSTLAYDVAPNYAEELLKCQRYQVVYEQVGTFAFDTISANIIAQSSTNAYGFISLPVPMRSTPAITISTGGVTLSDESNNFTVSALSQLKLVQNSLKIEVISSGLTVGKSYHLMLSQGGKMILDSNL